MEKQIDELKLKLDSIKLEPGFSNFPLVRQVEDQLNKVDKVIRTVEDDFENAQNLVREMEREVERRKKWASDLQKREIAPITKKSPVRSRTTKTKRTTSSSPQRRFSSANVSNEILINCNLCKKEIDGTRTCTGCNAVSYCDKQCQSKDWESHRNECTK